MLQRTIRDAKSVVAVVSLRQFGSHTWEELPAFIANKTNVQASAVVVTMHDATTIMPDELDFYLNHIKSIFWPRLDKDAVEGSILMCSSLLGIKMQVMKQFLEEAKTLPDFDAFWTPMLEPVS